MSLPCHDFQVGRCTYGAKCRFSHATSSNDDGRVKRLRPSDMCMAFAKDGRCLHGARCIFRHDQRPVVAGSQPTILQCRIFASRGQCKFGASCTFSHGHAAAPAYAGTGAGTGSAPAGPPRPNDPGRRFFDHFMRNTSRSLGDARQAKRFAGCLETYSDGDLPWRLTRRGEQGLKLTVEAVRIGGPEAAIAIARALLQPQYAATKFTAALNAILRELYAASDIVETLTQAVDRGTLHEPADLKALTDLGVAICYADPKALVSIGALNTLRDAANLAATATAADGSTCRPRLGCARRLTHSLPTPLHTAE